MKLFSTIAAAAVIGSSLFTAIPNASAEVHANLDTGVTHGVNNNKCMYYVTKNGVTKSINSPGGFECNPWKGEYAGYSQSMNMWGSSRQEAERIWNNL